jgi:hypothetical protein
MSTKSGSELIIDSGSSNPNFSELSSSDFQIIYWDSEISRKNSEDSRNL